MTEEECREILIELVGPDTFRAQCLRDGREPVIFFREIIAAMRLAATPHDVSKQISELLSSSSAAPQAQAAPPPNLEPQCVVGEDMTHCQNHDTRHGRYR